MIGFDMKRCSSCKRNKELIAFSKNSRQKDGKQNQCRVCKKTFYYNNHQNEKYFLKKQNWKLKNRYGITIEEKENMRTSQGDKCAICNNEFKSTEDTCVDHDHKTNKVRKLLCNNCNVGIGSFHDNPNLLISASQYLLDFTK
jgi:protein-arginine kinase activator protein McsA